MGADRGHCAGPARSDDSHPSGDSLARELAAAPGHGLTRRPLTGVDNDVVDLRDDLDHDPVSLGWNLIDENSQQ